MNVRTPSQSVEPDQCVGLMYGAEPASGAAPVGWSVEGMPRVLRHGQAHFAAAAACIAQQYIRIGPAVLTKVWQGGEGSCLLQPSLMT